MIDVVHLMLDVFFSFELINELTNKVLSPKPCWIDLIVNVRYDDQ